LVVVVVVIDRSVHYLRHKCARSTQECVQSV
jgi:hypothetical protein